MINLVKNIYKLRDQGYERHIKIPRFIISGGLATAVNLGSLFAMTHFLRIWYLISAMFAFLFAFGVSFGLQKFWTFRDHSKEGMHRQARAFFLIMILGIVINTSLLYAFVEYAGLHYLVAQFLSGIFIAFFNFAMYQKFIFHNSP